MPIPVSYGGLTEEFQDRAWIDAEPGFSSGKLLTDSISGEERFVADLPEAEDYLARRSTPFTQPASALVGAGPRRVKIIRAQRTSERKGCSVSREGQ